jgi:hypothetical protein
VSPFFTFLSSKQLVFSKTSRSSQILATNCSHQVVSNKGWTPSKMELHSSQKWGQRLQAVCPGWKRH